MQSRLESSDEHGAVETQFVEVAEKKHVGQGMYFDDNQGPEVDLQTQQNTYSSVGDKSR